MSDSSLPSIPQLASAGLDLKAEANLADASLRPLYDEVVSLVETYLGAGDVTVLEVRALRNAHRDIPVHQLQSLADSGWVDSAGPALLYRAAQLQLLAGQLDRAVELSELAVVRSCHSADTTLLLTETARFQLERAQWSEALAAYQRLAAHDEQAFPLPSHQYELQRVLGAGGFSTVFLCREMDSGAQVVIKAMDLSKELSQQIDPFHEADLLRQVEHPGIVKLLQQGFTDPATRRHPFIALEFVPGWTLHDYVQRYGPLSWQNWLAIASQVLVALQAVHQSGIVHRDVKPSNLLLNFDSNGWHVKLIDFGIAVRRPMPAGTMGFAAPEQLRHNADQATSVDVYAFARTTCYAITGKPELSPEQAAVIPERFAQLLEACQSRVASERPTLRTLINEVEGMLNNKRSEHKQQAPKSSAVKTPVKATSTDLVPPEPPPKTWQHEEAGDSKMQPEQMLERALIVEPDPQTRDWLKEILEYLNYEVQVARGFSSALKVFDEAQTAQLPFKVVLVSAHLHIGNPQDVLITMRTSDRKATLVIVERPGQASHPGQISSTELKRQNVKHLRMPCGIDDVRKLLQPEQETASCSMGYMPKETMQRPTPAPITTTFGPAAKDNPPVGEPAAPKTAVPPPSSVQPQSAPEGREKVEPIQQPTPIESRPPASGEFAMWPRVPRDPSPTELPNSYPGNPFDSPPDRPLSRPPRTDIPAAPDSLPTPNSSSGFDVQETVASAFETVTKKIGGWFKKKPQDTSAEGTKSHDGTQAADQIQRDQVDCTVYAPPEMSPGETIMIQAMLHLPEQAQLAATLAKEFDESATTRGARSLDTSIARGSKVAFQLTAPGLEIDDATPPAIVWLGRPEGVQFGVTAPAGFPHRTLICTVLVTLESVPIGQIKFKLSVGPPVPAISPLMAASNAATKQSQPHQMSRYQMVFISYASADRDEVLKRVQMLKRFNVNFFQDVLNLEPGERWEQSLYKHIDESDLFLLFWSSAAKDSKWVREEVKYALSRRAKDQSEVPEIVPVVLEGPPVPIPHEELAHLHFNDQILHFVANRYSSSSS